MRDDKDLARLVEQGEGKYLEFKKKTVNLEKMVKELVAFSNTGGGVLLVGVSDDGELSGVKNPEEDLFLIEKSVKHHTIPAFIYTTEIIPLNSTLSIIKIKVPQSKKRPHYFRPAPGKYGDAYIRIEDECVRASREMRNYLRALKRRSTQVLQMGDNEKRILDVLAERGEATVSDFMEALPLKRRDLSMTLIKLATAGVLQLIPKAGEKDVFRQS